MMKLKNCKTKQEKLAVILSYVFTGLLIGILFFCIIGSIVAFKLYSETHSRTLKASAESDLNFDNYYSGTYYCSAFTNNSQVNYPFRLIFPLNNNAAQQSKGLFLQSYLNGSTWSDFSSSALIPFDNWQAYFHNPIDYNSLYDYLIYRIDISDLIGTSSVDGYFTVFIDNRSGAYVHPFISGSSVNGFVVEHSISNYPAVFSCEFFTLSDFNYYNSLFSSLEWVTEGQTASYFAPVRNSMKLTWTFYDTENNSFDITVFCPALFYNSNNYQGELDYEINFLEMFEGQTSEGSSYYNTIYDYGYHQGLDIGRGLADAELGYNEYNRGYNNGYERGYDVGISTTWDDISPFEMISSGVTSFLNMEIFPGFKFSSVFLIAVGLILLGAFFKLFFHG